MTVSVAIKLSTAQSRVPCNHGMAHPQVGDGGDVLQVWKVAANMQGLDKK
jgi:hypothetical protein